MQDASSVNCLILGKSYLTSRPTIKLLIFKINFCKAKLKQDKVENHKHNFW